MARDSLRIAVWTALSRVTGLLRAVVVAAVLGPTYLGSVFQAAYVLPALVYQMLVGSLFVALLVPELVRAADRADEDRIAGGFMTVACLVFAAVALAVMAAAPLLLAVFTAGVADPVAADEQRRAGLILIALMIPQVVLFAVAGCGAAVMNAHGRFALAAGAPALENVGVVATLLVAAPLSGTTQLAVLGAGATASVAVHAGTQWWGALRCGVRLRPFAGWHDSRVRALLRRAVPSAGVAGLDAARQLAVLPVANRVPGGVVAFQLAVNFANLPVALGAKPVATALLPRLARLSERGAIRDEFVRGLALASFVTLPAAVAYIALAEPLSRAIAQGEMATPAGIAALAACLAALAPGVLGDGGFHVGTHACYALRDARSPLVSSLVRTAFVLGGIAIACLMAPSTAMLVVLGLGVSAGQLAGAWHLGRRFVAGLPPGAERLGPSLRRTLAASLLAAGPAWAAATALPHPAGLGVACLLGLALFAALEGLWGAPELRWAVERR